MMYSDFLKAMVTDVDGSDSSSCSKIFCSQSVVLMLRECLDEEAGAHKELVQRLKRMNSRLVSPRMVFNHLSVHPLTRVISNEELWLLGVVCSPKETSKG